MKFVFFQANFDEILSEFLEISAKYNLGSKDMKILKNGQYFSQNIFFCFENLNYLIFVFDPQSLSRAQLQVRVERTSSSARLGLQHFIGLLLV